MPGRRYLGWDVGGAGSEPQQQCRQQAAAVSQHCGQSLVGQDPGCNFGWGVGSSPAPLMQLQQVWDSVLVFFSVLLNQQWMCLPEDLILRLWMKKATEIFPAFFEMLASIPVCKRGLQMGLPLQQTWRRVLVSGLCAMTVTMRHRMSLSASPLYPEFGLFPCRSAPQTPQALEEFNFPPSYSTWTSSAENPHPLTPPTHSGAFIEKDSSLKIRSQNPCDRVFTYSPEPFSELSP